ncbi:hypothetical protein LguiA_023079 [Lonicera macranthoides]
MPPNQKKSKENKPTNPHSSRVYLKTLLGNSNKNMKHRRRNVRNWALALA